MQSFRIAPTRQFAAREFVNDNHFVVFHHIMAVALKQRLRAKRLFHVIGHPHAAGRVNVFHAEPLFHFFDACIGEVR